MALPTIQNSQKTRNKGSGSVVASIGKKFVQQQRDMGKAGLYGTKANRSKRGNPARGRRGRQAKAIRPNSSQEAVEKIVNSTTVTNNKTNSFDQAPFHKKAFDVYLNLINYVKNSIKDLIQKVKTIIGLSKETKQSNEVASSAITGTPKVTTTPSIEETREGVEEKERQTEIQTDSLSELGKINNTLEKIRKILAKGIGSGGGGSGGGLLDTLSDAANVASFVKGGVGGGKFGRMMRIAKSGGAGKLAAARNASKPVQAIARTSDKVVKGLSSVKEGIKTGAGRLAGRASQMLGLGTRMGAGAVTAAGGVASGAAGAAGSVAGGVASGAASSVASGAASAAGGAASAAGSAASGAAASGGGWLSRMFNPLKNVKELLKTGGGKVLKTLLKVPVIGTAISTLLAGYEISQIKNNPDLSPKEKREKIGNVIASSAGGMIGGVALTAGAQALNILPGLGVALGPLAYFLGDTAGSWLVSTLMEQLGGGESVYNVFKAIPGLGRFVEIPEDQEKDPKEEAKKDLEKAQDFAPPPLPPPQVSGEPATLSSALQKTPTTESATGSSVTPSAMGTPSASTAQISSSVSATAGEALRKETQQSINNNILYGTGGAAVSAAPTGPNGNVINNYYNTVSAGSGGGNETSAATSSSEPDSTMRKMLAGNVGGVST
jgi:hypothetical protein